MSALGKMLSTINTMTAGALLFAGAVYGINKYQARGERVVIDYCERVRQEGEKVRLTYWDGNGVASAYCAQDLVDRVRFALDAAAERRFYRTRELLRMDADKDGTVTLEECAAYDPFVRE
jgi:hypothetical protein